jgi:hypothetical protein
LIRRSPLPPAAVAKLQAWLVANLDDLRAATAHGRLLDAIAQTVLDFVNSRPIHALSNQAIVPRLLGEWVAGRSFAVIFTALRDAAVRVGRDHATVEDAVALCESGFGYDVAMIIASFADLAEGVDDDLQAAASLLQRQVKYGLRRISDRFPRSRFCGTAMSLRCSLGSGPTFPIALASAPLARRKRSCARLSRAYLPTSSRSRPSSGAGSFDRSHGSGGYLGARTCQPNFCYRRLSPPLAVRPGEGRLPELSGDR